MSSSRAKALIQQWTAQQHIAPQHVSQSLELAEVTPAPARWFNFLDKLLLANGGGLLLVGIIFFFAFNWQEITRFHKFALLEGLVVAGLWAYGHWFGKASANICLLAAAVLLGVLLAFYGQTYQTGADTWQLFAVWAALITPWALLAEFAGLWLLWLMLINLALFLYYQTFHGLFGLFLSGEAMQVALFAVNTLALALWETMARRLTWLRASRREVRMLAVLSGFSITWLMIDFIFSHGFRAAYVPLTYGVWLGGFYLIYRRKAPDLFMLAGASLTAIVISTAWLSDIFLQAKDGGALFIIALWIMLVSGAAIRWLKAVAQELPHE